MTIRNSTITQNTSNNAYYAGGISYFAYDYETLNIGNTIIAGNIAPSFPEIKANGQVISAGYNLIGDSAGDAVNNDGFITYQTSDILDTSPMLGALQNNGGATPTRALLTGSPAIDKGTRFGSTTDQRGFLRPYDYTAITNSGDSSDIGAFELHPNRTISGQVTNGGAALAGVSIALSGSTTNTATTNSTGNYSFTVGGGGSYTVTPTLANYSFTPVSSTFNNIAVNQPANFAATNTCTYSISPTLANAVSGSHTGTVAVTAPTGCAWTAVSNDTWITVTSGANGSANGTVGYSVAANTGSARSGTITIAGKTFTVNQASGCAYTLSVASASAVAAASTGSFTVTTTAGCTWTPVSNDSWITISAGATRSGSGTVNYSVAANSGPVRSGTITAAGKTFTVNQANGCVYTLSANSAASPANGASGSVNVVSSTGCVWTAVSNAAWLSVTAATGTGTGTVQYTVGANAGAVRTGTITTAGKTFTVNQAAASYSRDTSTGQNVPVAPTGDLDLVFSNVTTGGSTTATPLSQNQLEPLPSNFTLIANPIIYDITTTAVFSGGITVTLRVPNVADAATCGNLKILHFENGAWTSAGNATPQYNAGTQTCTLAQTVTSLSPFAVVLQTPASFSYEADVSPRPNGDGFVDSDDIQQIRLFSVGGGLPYQSNEFQRVDCSPRSTLGDGFLDSDDIQQARRYSVGTDSSQLAGGPSSGSAPFLLDSAASAIDETFDNSTLFTNRKSKRSPAFRIGGQINNADQTITVPVLIDATGKEAGYTFSLSYDAEMLSNPQVTIGSAGGDVIFNANTEGHIGFSVTSFFGETIAPGANQVLVNVTFKVAANAAAGTTAINFTDVLARRKASGVDPNIAVTQPTYTGGTLTFGLDD